MDCYPHVCMEVLERANEWTSMEEGVAVDAEGVHVLNSSTPMRKKLVLLLLGRCQLGIPGGMVQWWSCARDVYGDVRWIHQRAAFGSVCTHSARPLCDPTCCLRCGISQFSKLSYAPSATLRSQQKRSTEGPRSSLTAMVLSFIVPKLSVENHTISRFHVTASVTLKTHILYLHRGV